jgi:1-acyl-sn-glycerol-3-phosphate acyltransferase
MVSTDQPSKSLQGGVRTSPEILLEQVRTLAAELNPQRRTPPRVTLDSSLDRDLGFDSLSRVELALRLERMSGLALPEQLLARAETVGDLWEALGAGVAQVRRPAETERAVPLDESEGTPRGASTLLEMLDWHVQRHPQRPHVYLYGDADEPQTITYAGLAEGAHHVAAGLQAQGLLPGQSVAIMLPTSRDYLYSFLGILLAGGIPVPIYPPLRPSQLEDHLRRHAGILNNAEATLLITLPEAKRVAHLLQGQVTGLRDVLTPADLDIAGSAFSRPTVNADDIAFLQYTSGSTGMPKGVILSHADLLANIRAMGEAVLADSQDVFVSWLPLYHDMGLIGAWLGSMYFAMPLVLMSPLAFLTRPRRWLWTIHRHRGTLTAAPNFAYELCLTKLDDTDIDGLDLSSLRLAFNGAEPVSPKTLQQFARRFADFGLRRQALAPVYGLAEAAVGLAFPPPDRGPLIDTIQRDRFTARGEAIPADATQADTLEFVACGRPLPGYEVRIVDSGGRELPERREGRLEFRGPSATRGYLNNPEATARLRDGTWLDTGDLAYVAEGDVYPTGRVKDIIIRGGRNIYPHELEEAVGDITGVRRGCVAAFGSPDPMSGTERLVIVAETRETESETLQALQEDVRRRCTDLIGIPPDEVVLGPPHSVLKTSSGKVRRAAVSRLFERGLLGRRPRAVWLQVVRVALSGWRLRLRRLWRWSIDLAYAGYAHAVFWLLAVPGWLLIVALPDEGLRWMLMRRAARLLFLVAGVPLRVQGLEHWPQDGHCVIVANHASYLDGVVLVATLPGRFAFVAKRELSEKLIPRLFLQRIGAVFVERLDQQKGVSDAQHTVDVLQAGRSLMVFAEGTFTRIPGLRKFRMGAFVAATEAGVAAIPVTLNGTRSVLRERSHFPHRGEIRVSIAAPIEPAGDGWDAAVRLRNSVRQAMLETLDEPDLLQD